MATRDSRALATYSAQTDYAPEPPAFPEPSFYARFGKRALDLVLALLLLTIALPIIALAAVAVLLTSGLPVFYAARRAGKEGRDFRMWKLRTMVRNADEILHYWKEKGTEEGITYIQGYKLRNDPRVTRVGSFLRKTSIDELPQLLNVVRGEMSLVGPRPVVEEELEHYGDDREALLSVRPGVTGLWQVNGRSAIDYPERVDIELAYLRGISLARDVRLLLRTVPLVLKGSGL